MDGMVGKLTFQVNANAAAGTYTVEVYRKAGSGEVTGSVTFEVKESQTSGDRLPGDVNGDGEVDSVDSLIVLKYSVGQDVTIILENADVNADGEIDSIDSLMILKYSVGQDVVLQ